MITTIEHEGLIIQIFKKKIKHMYLRIDPSTGQIKISAPIKFSTAMIREQLLLKSEWIELKRKQIQLRLNQPPLVMQQDEIHYFLGNQYSLTIHENASKNKIMIVDKSIHCFIKPNTTVSQKKVILNSWYRQQLQLILPALIEKWEQRIGVNANEYTIKIMKTRWGTCNVIAKRIWLNLQLVKKPIICLEYVLVHELVHLLEANHSKRFYAHMDLFMPEWVDIKKQLELIGM